MIVRFVRSVSGTWHRFAGEADDRAVTECHRLVKIKTLADKLPARFGGARGGHQALCGECSGLWEAQKGQ